MTAYLADALDKRAETGCHRCSTQTDEGKEVDAAYDTCAGCINYRHCRTHPCSAGCTDVRAETYTLDALSRAASGLYKAKGGHYDIKSEDCIVSHQGQ